MPESKDWGELAVVSTLGLPSNTITLIVALYRLQTLPKAQRTRGLSSYHKITVHSSQILITISESGLSINFKISTKHQYLDLKS